MKLRTLSLPILATGLLLGCNPEPRPSGAPTGDTMPVVDSPRASDPSRTIMVYMNQVSTDGIGESAGTIVIRQTAEGLTFTPNLQGLPAGEHGFHIHQNPSCEAGMKDGVKHPAAAAGGHFDPTATGRHAGPQGDGHQGDLPMIRVDDTGAQQEVTMSGLQLDDLKNRSLVVHQRPDDYTSDPAGDSGSPLACGVVK